MYETLAGLYDYYMDEVPYEKWLDNMVGYFNKYGNNIKNVLDLGCGTGSMSILLKQKGYDITGLDISEEMLAEAANKTYEAGLKIDYICQDMVALEVAKPYDAVISLCDCMNYITEDAELKKVFKNCYKALKPGGLFIFDMNSPYKLREVLGCDSFCETSALSAYTCENYFDEESGINEYYVNFFIKEKDGKYSRHEEIHLERAYEISQVEAMLKEAGFEVLEIADSDTLNTPEETTERFYFVAKR